MSSITSVPTRSRWKVIGLWTLKIALAFIFAGAAFKFSGAQPAVDEFAQIGFGQWFRYFTAGVELFGAVLLLVPRTAVYGAFLLTCVSIGAFFAQLLVLHQDVIHTIVFAAILGAIAWSKRDQILR